MRHLASFMLHRAASSPSAARCIFQAQGNCAQNGHGEINDEEPPCFPLPRTIGIQHRDVVRTDIAMVDARVM
jgi:hypothetical protein